MKILLLLFVIIPIVEMWLLIEVGGFIGVLWTIVLVMLTAFIGLAMLRHQGRDTLVRARQKLQMNQIPARELIDGLFFAIGGALLLTPGFMTDAIGFACLTPVLRRVIVASFFKSLLEKQTVYSFGSNNSRARESNVIEGDFRRHNKD